MNPFPPVRPTTRRRASVARRHFLADVQAGLRRHAKRLPSKYFYDARGSELFDRICSLDEYYLTGAEVAIMRRFAGEMGAQVGPGALLVEYGSGSSLKTRYLLDALPDPVAYVGVDVSGQHLRKATRLLARDYPHIEILSVCADFTKDFSLPATRRPASHIAVYFPGSTIGNFEPDEAGGLLARIARLCGVNGGLLIGIDLKKSPTIIEAAYNDPAGVTAQFNLNLLRRINRELGANFVLDRFLHEAHYNEQLGRIEMYLISRTAQTVTIGDELFEFAAGEAICTEYSYKYTLDGFASIAAASGFELTKEWTDQHRHFAVLHFHIRNRAKSATPNADFSSAT
jgi:dimethylhistidine N-methyltransferase